MVLGHVGERGCRRSEDGGTGSKGGRKEEWGAERRKEMPGGGEEPGWGKRGGCGWEGREVALSSGKAAK